MTVSQMICWVYEERYPVKMNPSTDVKRQGRLDSWKESRK
jgi:hypothetical protein